MEHQTRQHGLWAKRVAYSAALAFSMAVASQSAPADDLGGSFVSKFSRLDSSLWAPSNGWTNGDYWDCAWTRDNVRINEQKLRLELTKEPLLGKPFSCAEVQSRKLYGHGTYEVRMRATAASGVVSAFFSYSSPDPETKHNSEIDIEFLGRDTNKVQLNYLVDGQNQGVTLNDLGFDASSGMNDYAYEWLPDSLRWYINGKLVREVLREPGKPFPTHNSKIIMMIWNSSKLSEWMGPFENPPLPLSAYYDWVAFTKAGDKCQFPESIVCKIKK